MKSRKTNEPKRPFIHPRELSRSQRERLLSKVVIASVATIMVVLLGLLGVGYWREVLHKGDEPIAVVKGQPITLTTYAKLRAWRIAQLDEAIYQAQMQASSLAAQAQKAPKPTPDAAATPDASGLVAPEADPQDMLRQQMESQIYQLETERSSVDGRLLEELIESELVRQEAVGRGITVSSDEVDAEVVRLFSPPQTVQVESEATPAAGTPAAGASTATVQPEGTQTAQPTGAAASAEATKPAESTPLATQPAEPTTVVETPTPAPTLSPSEANDSLGNYLQRYNLLTVDEYRRWVIEPVIYERKLRDVVGAEAPATAEQVHARHILVQTEDEAKKVRERLDAGESFEKVAAEVSLDTSNKDKGGDLDWFGRGVMDPAFEKAAFSLEPGKISDPVKSSFGYHIIQVEERDANRQLSDDQLQTAKSAAYQNWLNGQRALGPDVVQRLQSTDKIQWAERYAANLMKAPRQ